MGFILSKPIGDNQPYDLLIDYNNRFIRCQSKTGRYRNGAIEFNTCASRLNTRKIYRTFYDGKCDLFTIWCPDTNSYYFFPVIGAPKTVAVLRIEPSKNNKIKGITFANNYAIDKLAAYLEKHYSDSGNSLSVIRDVTVFHLEPEGLQIPLGSP